MINDLSEEQKEALKYLEGPIMIIAGAGSGKTRVVTSRISYMINKGINPENILAITFTNKAASEMKKRVYELIKYIPSKMQISTFHSFGLTVLRKYSKCVGLQSNFTIFDNDDSILLVKRIIKELGYSIEEYNPKKIRNKISSFKNSLIDIENEITYSDIDSLTCEVYKIYMERLLSNNSLDFDDLLVYPITIFKNNPDILNEYQETYKYIFVDEYQDTNYAQFELINLLASKYRNICVVGDQDQSIYSFRGSDNKNISSFERHYPDAKIILLEQNFRSTKNILKVANDIIKNNKNRKDKKLWTMNEDGDKVTYRQVANEEEEASYVASKIKEVISSGVSENDIAILYRTNAQSRKIEEAMLKENIPYKVIGNFTFYNRKEIKDLISYLKLIYNSNDDISLMRVINVPKRKIGKKTIEKLITKAVMDNTSMYEAIDSSKELLFKEMIEDFKVSQFTMSLTSFIDYILDKTGIKQELQDENSIESNIRLENLEEFKSITKSFEEKNKIVSLEEFLNEISLMTDNNDLSDEDRTIKMMSIHSAKGLEFEYVYITGLEEGIFPHSRSLLDKEQLEEERRLFYVAVTRAKKHLELYSTKERLLFGERNRSVESRFITEINGDYLEINNSNFFKMCDKIDISSCEYQLGDKVFSEKFKEGVIVGIEDDLLVIAFQYPYGIRKMMKGHKSIQLI